MRKPINEPLRIERNEAGEFAKEFVALALCLLVIAAVYSVAELIAEEPSGPVAGSRVSAG